MKQDRSTLSCITACILLMFVGFIIAQFPPQEAQIWAKIADFISFTASFSTIGGFGFAVYVYSRWRGQEVEKKLDRLYDILHDAYINAEVASHPLKYPFNMLIQMQFTKSINNNFEKRKLYWESKRKERLEVFQAAYESYKISYEQLNKLTKFDITSVHPNIFNDVKQHCVNLLEKARQGSKYDDYLKLQTRYDKEESKQFEAAVARLRVFRKLF